MTEKEKVDSVLEFLLNALRKRFSEFEKKSDQKLFINKLYGKFGE